MGLKTFLQQQGFIADDATEETISKPSNSSATPTNNTVAPTFFPMQPAVVPEASRTDEAPSFVAPLPQTTASTAPQQQLDPTFVKFFEDELVKANLPGPDYFEFRQQLTKTQQKMAAKGVTAPDVVLQAVLMSFESQEITVLVDFFGHAALKLKTDSGLRRDADLRLAGPK